MHLADKTHPVAIQTLAEHVRNEFKPVLLKFGCMHMINHLAQFAFLATIILEGTAAAQAGAQHSVTPLSRTSTSKQI